MELTVSNRTIIRIVVIVLGAVVAVNLVSALRTQLVWMLTAFFLALALEPAVNVLSRFMPRRSRGLAVLIVLLVAGGLVTFVSLALVPPFASQLYLLITNLPESYRTFTAANPSAGHLINSHLGTAQVANSLQQFSEQLLSFGGSAVVIIGRLFGGIVAAGTVLLLTFFMVLEGPHWTEVMWRYWPARPRSQFQELFRQMHRTVTGYVGGNLITSLIAAVTTTIMLLIVHSPYTLALGLLVGIVDLIPLVGASLAAVLVCLAVLVFSGGGAAIVMVVFFLIYQQLENNILQPIIFSRAVEVSPLVTTVALIVGASLAGFVGALVAIPVAASIQIVTRYWLAGRRRERV